MNLIVNTYPKIDSHPLGLSLAQELAKRLKGKTQIIRIYESKGYFNYRYHKRWMDLVMKSTVIILPVPMWNFMIPGALKDFFDKIIKRGKLWDVDRTGKFVGLLSDRPVYIIMTSGGEYPVGSSHDFVVPYLKTVFAFIGIRSVKEFRIGKVANTGELTRNKVYFKEKTRRMFEAFGL